MSNKDIVLGEKSKYQEGRWGPWNPFPMVACEGGGLCRIRPPHIVSFVELGVG